MSKTTSQEKSKRGPKPRPESERRGEWIGAAVTKAEKLDFELRAAKAKAHPSLYLRDCCGFARRQGEGEKSA
jgi:hypothetical protein